MIEIITNFAVERCQVNRIDDEVSTDLIWTEFTWTAAGCCRFSSNSLLLDRLQSTDVLQSYDLLWQQAAKAKAAARLPQSKDAPSRVFKFARPVCSGAGAAVKAKPQSVLLRRRAEVVLCDPGTWRRDGSPADAGLSRSVLVV